MTAGGPIVVVAGPSGVGKSTVAALVASAVPRSAHVQQDVFLRFMLSGGDGASSPQDAQHGEVVGAAMATTAMTFAEGGFLVVLDGHLFPAGVQGLSDRCARQSIPVHYGVLRADIATCLERARRRGLPFDPSDYAAQHGAFSDLGRFEDHTVDASPPVADVSAALLSAFRSGRLLVPPAGADW